MSTLFLIATPIGNLEDITLRALRVLQEVKLIAAEDTRKSKRLLTHYTIRTPLTSYFEHSSRAKIDSLLSVLDEGDLALISEAGMPAISDPGFELVVAAIERGHRIVAVPGPSAVLAALAVSGLPTDRFLYLGFLPRRRADRRRSIQDVARRKETLIVFEAPHRLAESLADLKEILGDRPVAICREMTKVYEEVFRGTISAAESHFGEPRGEFTLVIGGAGEFSDVEEYELDLEAELRRLVERGVTGRDAVALLASLRKLPRKAVYQAWVDLTKRS